MRRKIFILLGLLFILTFLLVACGESDNVDNEVNNGNENNNNENVTNNEDANNVTNDTTDGGGDILIFARGGDSESLDPGSTTDGESSRVTRQILEGLLEFDKDSFELKPGLAHDWDESDDGLTYTFYLEENVTFHDGTDFNAEAVKLNFERWANPDHEYAFKDDGYVYSMYETMFGGYEGEEGHVIDEINIINDYEIEFVLNRPLGFFLQNLGMTYFAITSPAALEEYGADINENPVGTGPFQFVSWDKDESIVLEKFDDYRIEGQPKLEQVVFEVIPENSARLIALRSGDIDIMDGLNPDDAAGVEEDEELELLERGENNLGYLGFNVEKEPLDNKELRQAISHAIDREAIVEALYAGYASTGVNPLPPNYLGHNDDVEGYQYDVEKAEKLLVEAGYEDGVEIELWTMPVARPYMPDPETVAEIIQNNLAQVGIEANIVREEWAPYLEKTENGEQQMYMLGWSGTNGDPDYFLSSLFHSSNAGTSNTTFYKNDELDQLLDDAKVAVDQDEREDLYKQAQAHIAEAVPMIPLMHSRPVMAISKNVVNYIPHPSTSESLAEVELE